MRGLVEKKCDEQFVSELKQDLEWVRQMLPELLENENGGDKILLQQVEEECNAIFSLLG